MMSDRVGRDFDRVWEIDKGSDIVGFDSVPVRVAEGSCDVELLTLNVTDLLGLFVGVISSDSVSDTFGNERVRVGVRLDALSADEDVPLCAAVAVTLKESDGSSVWVAVAQSEELMLSGAEVVALRVSLAVCLLRVLTSE